jgi:glutamate carboxypeptidase
MPMPLLRRRTLALTLAAATLAACSTTAPPAAAPAAPATPARPADSALRARTQAEVPAYLKTLESLVAIESGSRDLEGLKRMAGVVADRLRAAGLQVELKPSRAPDFHPQLKGAELGSSVYATRAGTGTKKVLLIAHMDTVYPRGMAAKQPFPHRR